MKAIYACKLFKSSPRQDKIKAAISDPLNAELVTQLRSYLDEEYQELAEPKKVQPIDFDKPGLNDGADSESNSSKSNSTSGRMPVGPRPSGGSLSEKFDALIDDEEGDEVSEPSLEVAETDGGSDVEEDIDDMQEIGESTNIPASATDQISLPNVVEEIKGMLNLDENTQGINRILVKDNEFWVYYNDSVNLNNVMGPVIEKINAAGYSYLDFNRLARSDNAIVFQINIADTGITDEEDISEQ